MSKLNKLLSERDYYNKEKYENIIRGRGCGKTNMIHRYVTRMLIIISKLDRKIKREKGIILLRKLRNVRTN